jgi:hypothetical protein
MTTSPISLIDITEYDLKVFESIVLNDVKNSSTDEEIDYLKSNLDLWVYTLLVMRRNAEYSLSSRNSSKKATLSKMTAEERSQSEIESFLTSESQWRINTIKFLSVLEKKILYVKILIKQS